MSCRAKWAGPQETTCAKAGTDLEALLRASLDQPKPARPDWVGEHWTIGVPVSLKPQTTGVGIGKGDTAKRAAALIHTPLPPPPVIVGRTAPQGIAEVLSPSQVNGYIDCSARWHYKYVRGLDAPPTGKQVRGKAVHALVSYYFKQRMQGVTPDSDTLAEAYTEIWDAESFGAEFSAKDEPADLHASGAELAALYLREAGEQITPAATELAVEGRIGGVQVRGYVDLLCQDAEGKIIDLKTSSRTPSSVSAGHALQLATYAQLTPKATGLVQIDTLVDTKVKKLHRTEYRVSDMDLKLTERLYPAVQDSMRRGIYLPNRGSFFCNRSNCAYAEACCEEFGGHVD